MSGIYAIVTGDGTAAAETALCPADYESDENRVMAERQAESDVTGPWSDCTGNDALRCIVCGADDEGTVQA